MAETNSVRDLLPFERIARKILVKKQAETNASYGCNPEERPTEELIQYGIVNIDKPKGPTSHQVSDYVQKILKIEKAGHSGTLDPHVTGVLPIAIGRATRIVQALLPAGKEYVCLMHIHDDVEEDKLRDVINSFVGKIKQMPPIKSAVKRQWRFRNVYYIDIMEIDGKDILFKVGCEAGTYIRKLCHDIGQKLGSGAHMAELRRTKAGPFDESTIAILQDLADAFYYYKEEKSDKYVRHVIQQIENAVNHLPKLWVLDTTVDSLAHGADLNIPVIAKLHDNIEPDQTVAIMTLKDELVALGISRLTSKKILDQVKGVAVKTDKVFMLPDVYPRIVKASKSLE